jgi:hypothetical protein
LLISFASLLNLPQPLIGSISASTMNNQPADRTS